MCEEIQKVLGFDWLLLFVQGHIHSSTVVKASLILLTILQNQAATQKFREGSLGGGWLKGTEPVLKQHVGVMLGKYSIEIIGLQLLLTTICSLMEINSCILFHQCSFKYFFNELDKAYI